ncbi:MAG: anaerobic ribonucleoside-triphosphate reductase activating protein [Eubacteriales bacterium]|nr:anaerobic ribonucleoside-triphosphate reductase activating protein [Eubacteriales bacterium]
MKFAGLVKNSFVDFPNNISAVVFTFGCNFNCWYCHNRRIIEGEKIETYSEDDILNFLDKRKEQLDGLVISGGEPTLCEGLESFIKKVKEKGFLVKLDTNGSNPRFLKNLFQKTCLILLQWTLKHRLKNMKK